MKRKMILSSGVLALLSLVGCGGGGGSTLVNPSLVVNWAERTRAINAPSSAQSVKITLDSPQPTVADVVWVINRGSNLAAFSQSYTSPEQVPSGAFSLRVELFADANAAGAEVGEGVLSVNVSPNGEFRTPTGDPVTNIAIDRTVKSVALAAASVQEGASVELSAAALDVSGGLVPVSPGSFRYSVATNPGNLSLTEAGVLTGVLAGKSTVTASIDGVTSAPSNVSISPVPSNYVRSLGFGVRDVEIDRLSRFAYVIPSNGGKVQKVDLRTGDISDFATPGGVLTSLGLSSDGNTLYVGSETERIVRVYATVTGALSTTVSLGNTTSSYAYGIAVDPTDSGTIAVAMGMINGTPSNDLRVYVNGQLLGESSGRGLSNIVFSSNGDMIFGSDRNSTANSFTRFSVSDSSVVVNWDEALVSAPALCFAYTDGKIVFWNGRVFNAVTLQEEQSLTFPDPYGDYWRALVDLEVARSFSFREILPDESYMRGLQTGSTLVQTTLPRLLSSNMMHFQGGSFAVWTNTQCVLVRYLPDYE